MLLREVEGLEEVKGGIQEKGRKEGMKKREKKESTNKKSNEYNVNSGKRSGLKESDQNFLLNQKISFL
ncbi:MAG: hypothetical protein Q9M97_05720 [Candidatus Gracilibacteria bacterium]|nr:hypothetical protein [Candidatus Gracilibacteria bacterium]